jgi:leucyl aminopeptidase
MKTDIIEQKEFDLLTEKNDIVITNNLKNDIVKQLDKIFDGKLKELSTEPFTTIHSLGKIAAKRVLVDTFETKETYLEIMQILSEKILTNNYEFINHKSEKKDKVKNFYYYGETKIYDAVKKGYVLGDCINHAKDLVNTPYNFLNANDLAIYAQKLERFKNVTVEIFEKDQIEAMNMGAFLGVNKGSIEPPKLILVKYQGRKEFNNPTALVGKGVMYDTGGYSLKTPVGMPGMKVDMAGSAAVISALEAIARLELKANVMAIVAATDNRIGDNAIVPDDILTAANGKTIEIISTDAEGRLTLADAVWFAQQQGAKKVIDTATLTGSMVAALGHEYTGAFTNNKDFFKKFYKASRKAKEQVWEMPISRGYKKLIESKVADIKNTGGRLAGASTAAQFIAEFIEKDTKWIHLDIAGTASNEQKEATGVMVKSFTELFY